MCHSIAVVSRLALTKTVCAKQAINVGMGIEELFDSQLGELLLKGPDGDGARSGAGDDRPYVNAGHASYFFLLYLPLLCLLSTGIVLQSFKLLRCVGIVGRMLETVAKILNPQSGTTRKLKSASISAVSTKLAAQFRHLATSSSHRKSLKRWNTMPDKSKQRRGR
ncbi:hypothetical protein L596_005434 [Steinernema carpocapsae]|uniref:Uncharacterized protein n=1 Tax=Steinernema carpocapsae TaxID=34508 RepID=A0A4U8UZ03_STECR|nr:hypothetical protein L596_005434 [Steinernema carpocapsae]